MAAGLKTKLYSIFLNKEDRITFREIVCFICYILLRHQLILVSKYGFVYSFLLILFFNNNIDKTYTLSFSIIFVLCYEQFLRLSTRVAPSLGAMLTLA